MNYLLVTPLYANDDTVLTIFLIIVGLVSFFVGLNVLFRFLEGVAALKDIYKLLKEIRDNMRTDEENKIS